MIKSLKTRKLVYLSIYSNHTDIQHISYQELFYTYNKIFLECGIHDFIRCGGDDHILHRFTNKSCFTRYAML